MEKHVYSILAIDLDEGIIERTEKEQPEYPLKYIYIHTKITDNNSVTDQPITAIICHKNRGMTWCKRNSTETLPLLRVYLLHLWVEI